MGEFKLIMMIGVISNVDAFGRRLGPYDMKVEELEKCKDQGSRKIVFDTRINNAGKGKYVFRDSFTLGVPIDDKLKSAVEVQRWGNGGWRRFMQHTFTGCEEVWRFLGKDIQAVMKAANTTVDRCPIPAGTYKVDDWPVRFNVQRAVPVMEYGTYRGGVRWYYNRELVGCLMATMELVPKALF